MSSSSGQSSLFSHKTPKEAYAYYKMREDPKLASNWDETMVFCGTIGDNGKKMLLATLLIKQYSATQIAKAFTTYHFQNKTMSLGSPFKCNHNDIIKAEKYLREMTLWSWTIKFNEENRFSWEKNKEMLAELHSFIEMLEKGIPESEINREVITSGNE